MAFSLLYDKLTNIQREFDACGSRSVESSYKEWYFKKINK